MSVSCQNSKTKAIEVGKAKTSCDKVEVPEVCVVEHGPFYSSQRRVSTSQRKHTFHMPPFLDTPNLQVRERLGKDRYEAAFKEIVLQQIFQGLTVSPDIVVQEGAEAQTAEVGRDGLVSPLFPRVSDADGHWEARVREDVHSPLSS